MTIRHIVCIILFTLPACARSDSVAVLSPSRSMDREVLSTALPAVVGAPSLGPYLIQDSTRSFEVPAYSRGESNDQPIPDLLKRELSTQNTTRSVVEPEKLPSGARIVRTDTLASFFSSGAAKGWMRFRSAFPATRGYFQLTKPAFNADSTDALLYVDYHCGPLCGSGRLLHLVRDSTNVWRVRQNILFWIS